ncbi:MAG: hypothetical protein KC544_08050 [Gemmatimonadetes bacterium]|nr:hypothetical protein [Gemmatimonadota bacterium]MCB9519202.1 hypothetical protein [Gemmatimonadales bacterium]HRY09961.1 hypothetical protein [Candidatus Nanopelagicales bacterium]
MQILPTRPVSATSWGLAFWIVGMVAGIVVYAVPRLKATPPVHGLSANPWITLMILAAWIAMAWFLARSRLPKAADPTAEGLRLGILLCVVNVLLDLAIVVKAMGTGGAFYRYLGPWLAYASLVVVPWLVGRIVAEGG